DAYAGSHSALSADGVGLLADDDAAGCGDHHTVAGGNHSQAGQPRLGLLELDADDSYAAPSLPAELLDVNALAVTVGGDDQHVRFRFGLEDVEAHDSVAFAQSDGSDTARRAAHRTQLFFAVANAHAVACADDDVGC